ncbi:hypothetical protein [Bowdeniella massiliensis]|uniref:hypothetical protein n=1 Tax=Bowdeniella massiliensis TaxID=2932264 RepID=UPI002027878C|nr:hypothetical protein [Bowdeniella massiliensis]
MELDWDGTFLASQMAELTSELGHDRVAEVRIWSNSITVQAYANADTKPGDRVNTCDVSSVALRNKGKLPGIDGAPFSLSEVSWNAVDQLLDEVPEQVGARAMDVVSVTVTQTSSGPKFLITVDGEDGAANFIADANASHLTPASGAFR